MHQFMVVNRYRKKCYLKMALEQQQAYNTEYWQLL